MMHCDLLHGLLLRVDLRLRGRSVVIFAAANLSVAVVCCARLTKAGHSEADYVLKLTLIPGESSKPYR